jgi:V/A-type H+-transporting ATPase subunit I
MRSADRLGPVRMQRIALVAPETALREVLVEVADAGVVEFDRDAVERTATGEAARRLRGTPTTPEESGAAAALSPDPPDLDDLVERGRVDLLTGEAELQDIAAGTVHRGEVGALLGWCPAPDLPRLIAAVAPLGTSVVPLPTPRGTDPPTFLAPSGPLRSSFGPLISTYGTVPYPDIDPTLLAGIAYVLMFGMMFGDAGHGAVLLIAALALRMGRPRRFPRLRERWAFVAGAGAASVVFGALYGEFFGPTGVLPVLWLAPLEAPTQLLAAGVGVGAVLLGAAFVVAIIDRWREGGPQLAVYASAGVAGALTFLGIGALAVGLYVSSIPVVLLGAVIVAAGVLLSGAGFFAAAGGGPAGALQAAVEAVDAVVRTGSNMVSFARLAAFGLTHAALGALVWDGTTLLARRGGMGLVGGVVVFLVGNALTFTLEGVVAAIQALRLEFYELFSRIFVGEGRPFRPWHVPTARPDRSLLPPEVAP